MIQTHTAKQAAAAVVEGMESQTMESQTILRCQIRRKSWTCVLHVAHYAPLGSISPPWTAQAGTAPTVPLDRLPTMRGRPATEAPNAGAVAREQTQPTWPPVKTRWSRRAPSTWTTVTYPLSRPLTSLFTVHLAETRCSCCQGVHASCQQRGLMILCACY